MKARAFVSVFILMCAQVLSLSAQERARVYDDPDGAYRLSLPAGWKVERKSEEGGGQTFISSDSYTAKLIILSGRVPARANDSAEFKMQLLTGVSEPYFRGWLEALKEQARVDAGKVYQASLNGHDALRLDVTYYRGDSHDPRKGYATFLLANHTALFITLTGDQQGFAALEKIISTIVIEP